MKQKPLQLLLWKISSGRVHHIFIALVKLKVSETAQRNIHQGTEGLTTYLCYVIQRSMVYLKGRWFHMVWSLTYVLRGKHVGITWLQRKMELPAARASIGLSPIWYRQDLVYLLRTSEILVCPNMVLDSTHFCIIYTDDIVFFSYFFLVQSYIQTVKCGMKLLIHSQTSTSAHFRMNH